MIPDAKNILIIKWGALGDLIMATSTIKTVRENYPHAKITMLANSIMRQLLPEGEIIDEYLLIKKSGRRVDESALNQFKLIFTLRRRKFDLVINLKWKSERAALLTYLTNAKTRVGYKENSFYNVFTHSIIHPAGGYHEIYRNMDIVKAIGLKPAAEKPIIFISGDDRAFARKFFEENKLAKEKTVCIHPGASKENRAWRPERYSELSKKIAEKFGVKILFTFGKDELNLVRGIKDAVGENALLSPQTKTVSQLAALIDMCGLFISVCTGPMNVANAVSTPIIALLGSTDPLDWSPFGEEHRTIKSPLVLNEYTDEDERAALDQISVEKVWSVVDKKLEELLKKS